MTKLPLYFNCHFFKSLGGESIYRYKIDASNIQAHPYQLFKRNINDWQNLSVYASVSDAVMILLKELFSSELADEINHGQATINPGEILEKINQGERMVSISGPQNEMFRIDFDVNFQDLVERP
ncbi:MAG TPA: hypothetical protein VFZ52_16030 [Chryseolinea sp.]